MMRRRTPTGASGTSGRGRGVLKGSAVNGSGGSAVWSLGGEEVKHVPVLEQLRDSQTRMIWPSSASCPDVLKRQRPSIFT
jgi:hypothetical protein